MKQDVLKQTQALIDATAVTTDVDELVNCVNDNIKSVDDAAETFLRSVAYLHASIGVLLLTGGGDVVDKLVDEGRIKDPTALSDELCGDVKEVCLAKALNRVLDDIKVNQSLTNTADFKRSDLSDLLN